MSSMSQSQLRSIHEGLVAMGLLPAAGAAGKPVTVASVALIPPAAPAFAGQWYWVTGANGGTMYFCDGISNIKVSPGLGEAGDFELIYGLGAPLTSGAAATTATVNLPDVIVPAGKVGDYGKLVIELYAEVTTFAGTLSARTLLLGLGGAGNLMNDTANLHRRVGLRRDIKGVGPSAQRIIERSNGEYSNLASINTAGQTLTKDMSVAQTITGSVSWTSDQAIVASVIEYRVLARSV